MFICIANLIPWWCGDNSNCSPLREQALSGSVSHTWGVLVGLWRKWTTGSWWQKVSISFKPSIHPSLLSLSLSLYYSLNLAFSLAFYLSSPFLPPSLLPSFFKLSIYNFSLGAKQHQLLCQHYQIRVWSTWQLEAVTVQLSLKMEPSTHGAGEAMGDWGMVNLCAKQLHICT